MLETRRRQWNKAAIAIGAVGIISVIVGLVLLFTDIFGPILRTGNTEPPTVSFVIGLILAGVGGLLVRGAFSMGLIVNAKPLARWAGSLMEEATRSRGASAASGTHFPQSSTVVKVRCSSCSALNDQQANFCNRCGAKLG